LNTGFSEHYQAFREDACRRGGHVLAKHSVTQITDHTWTGILANEEGKTVSVRIILPLDFPDALPELYIENPQALGSRAHIEANTKLCYAATAAMFIDAARPEQVILDALVLGKRTLLGADESTHRNDLLQGGRCMAG